MDESAIVSCRSVLESSEMRAVQEALEGARNECVIGAQPVESDELQQALLEAGPYYLKLLVSEAGVVTSVVGSFRYTSDPRLVDCVNKKLGLGSSFLAP